MFKTWSGTKEYVDADIMRFEKIWGSKDRNLKIYDIPNAVKERIFHLRTSDRPYQRKQKDSNRWAHQDRAVECFMEKEHGILAMATGTGKTVTTLKIIDKLFEEGKIRRAIITMYSNDLLDQWAKQIRETYKTKQIHYHYGAQKRMNDFIMHPDEALLLISRKANYLSKLLTLLDKAPGNYREDTLFIFDEVHGAGSSSLVENLAGKLSPYRYRLGYELSEEEKQKKQKIIAAFHAKKEKKEGYNEADMYTQLALVNKTAVDKIREFKHLVAARPELLEKCIIFVQTKEYGKALQEVLIRYTNRYHTYYAEDGKINLFILPKEKLIVFLHVKKFPKELTLAV